MSLKRIQDVTTMFKNKRGANNVKQLSLSVNETLQGRFGTEIQCIWDVLRTSLASSDLFKLTQISEIFFF